MAATRSTRTRSMHRNRVGNDQFNMDLVTLLALIGGVVAFILIDAIIDVLWVGFGAVIGAAIGLVIRRFTQQATVFAEAVDMKESATREELYEEAKRLGIEGRSQMDKDELVRAITDARTAQI